ncbi:MAG: hypothetical protein HQK54_07325 [Oligoflexales bacterium]|nr:hypothetical protein [Oligoflexales bacterium]
MTFKFYLFLLLFVCTNLPAQRLLAEANPESSAVTRLPQTAGVEKAGIKEKPSSVLASSMRSQDIDSLAIDDNPNAYNLPENAPEKLKKLKKELEAIIGTYKTAQEDLKKALNNINFDDDKANESKNETLKSDLARALKKFEEEEQRLKDAEQKFLEEKFKFEEGKYEKLPKGDAQTVE